MTALKFYRAPRGITRRWSQLGYLALQAAVFCGWMWGFLDQAHNAIGILSSPDWALGLYFWAWVVGFGLILAVGATAAVTQFVDWFLYRLLPWLLRKQPPAHWYGTPDQGGREIARGPRNG